MKKPTSSDVAKLAGVSQAAVSLILNGSEKITFSQETKDRVFEAARQLDYKLPIRKKGKHTPRIILVFTPTLTNTYYSELVQHVQEYAETCGYHVNVCNTFRNPKLERYYLDTRVTADVAGIIYSFLPTFPKLVEQLELKIPAVIIGEKQEELGLCSVGLNNAYAGAMLAEHLYQLGHRHIAFLSTPLDQFTMARSQRLEGVRRQLEQYGIGKNLEIIVADHRERDSDVQEGMPYEFAVGRHLTGRFLRGDYKATAIIGVNDMTALGIMAELADSGYRIPRDFSVCGFDNIFSANLTTPGLTTIDHHLRARCHAAADMLINPKSLTRMMPGMSDVPQVNKIEYTPRLVVRQSTGPCQKEE